MRSLSFLILALIATLLVSEISAATSQSKKHLKEDPQDDDEVTSKKDTKHKPTEEDSQEPPSKNTKLKTPSQVKDNLNVDARLKQLYNAKVEYYLDNKDRVSSCGKSNAPDGSQRYWFMLDPKDGILSSGHPDRSRIEARFTGKPSGRLGETWNYKWYFWVKADTVLTKQFFHLHQIKSEPQGPSADAPVITFTLANNKFDVKHIDSKGKTTVLKTIPASDILGKWISADETLTLSPKGSYLLTIKDATTGKALINIPKTSLDMWRGGTDLHPKMGIYRKHGDWPRTYMAFGEWKFTKLSSKGEN